MPGRLPRVIVAHASRAISLFNHDRSRAAVRSPEARERSRSTIACNASAMALSCRLAGNASSQAAYSAWRSTSAAMVSLQRRARLR